ncbi:YolD-like family protein [Alkalihalobacillus sp. LMS6]|uniref:YolD-like family protein n=1 Tax=Alkalihalobacillus sp. LMS6 TaxID=2924034 RepID=UPI0020D0F807|nr:YolD-like family protein [Alkalihalobacillus sp. LMS6]UTR07265.1 YolD-like family protein [Alkalihalobacillus sp. LMS6]
MRKEELFVKRGNLLWEGSRMMLPEHKESWLKLQQEESYIPLHELLSEDSWQELGETILEAMNEQHCVTVTIWNEGRYLPLDGVITKYDDLNKRIKLLFDDDYEWLNLRMIKDVCRKS